MHTTINGKATCKKPSIVTIVGARPNFIKMAALSPVLRESFVEIVIHTGQHYDYDLSGQIFDNLQLPVPNHHLKVGQAPIGIQLASMIDRLVPVLFEERPVGVVVFGDTTTTLAGALAAATLGLPIAHVEAGLRSFRREMPEEFNRVLVDHASTLRFAPTTTAVDNLRREGITDGVFQTGDVMWDALKSALPLVRTARSAANLTFAPQSYAMATIHRAINTDDAERLREILENLNRVAMPVIFPVHPRTRERIERFGLEGQLTGRSIIAVRPLDYVQVLALMQKSACVVTDSGGLQKEAGCLQVPCVTVRDETEWPETITAGWNLLTSPSAITETIHAAISSIKNVRRSLDEEYGNGGAAQKIGELLAAHWNPSKP